MLRATLGAHLVRTDTRQYTAPTSISSHGHIHVLGLAKKAGSLKRLATIRLKYSGVPVLAPYGVGNPPTRLVYYDAPLGMPMKIASYRVVTAHAESSIPQRYWSSRSIRRVC